MKAAVLGASLCVVAQPGCSRPDTPNRAAPTATSPAPELPLGSGLSSSTAFALAAAPFGVSVLWMERTSRSLYTLDLNAQGLPERPAWEIASLSPEVVGVSDLSFEWQGMNRVATWLELRGTTPLVAALFKTESESATPRSFGAAFPAATEARGNIALASSPETSTVLVRGEREPCSDERPCYGFRFHRFESAETPRVSLSVPVPCDQHAAQLLLTRERWYYAVCTTNQGEPVLTLFTIQPEPQYAAARQVFPGCQPRGALLLGERPALVAECEGRRHIAWLDQGDREPVVEPLRPALPDCTGNARLTVGRTEVALHGPQAKLESILPEPLVPDGAQAAWTGNVLVVAQPTADGLLLRRHACDRGAFVRLDDPRAAR